MIEQPGEVPQFVPAAAPNPGAELSAQDAAAERARATALAVQVAGGVLIAGALLGLATLATGSASDVGPIAANPLPYAIDIALGVSLMRGNRKWVGLVLFRVVLGSIIFAALAVARDAAVEAVAQGLFCAGVLLLLVGQPVRWRMRTGAALASSLLLLGLAGTLFPGFLVAGGFEALPGGVARGVDAAYTLHDTSGRLQQRSRDVVEEEMPIADLWLVDAANDLHIVTVCERLDDENALDEGVFLDAVAEQLASAGNGSIVEAGRPRVVAASGDDVEVKYLADVHVRGKDACQVLAWSLADTFAQHREFLARVQATFRFDP
ncbi:MAG: hypothetical protein HYS27_28605 [Deltaproteobacteria bacterium]|nr:hypothetical protein [Deltaproteobacteria bacterium]